MTYTTGGVQITYCKQVTNARKGAATIFVDAVNTNVASSTDSGIRTVGAPAQAGRGSVKAQSGDQFSIGVGTLDGNGAGETLDLADVPTC